MFKLQCRKWWLRLLIPHSIQGPPVLVEKTLSLTFVWKQEVQQIKGEKEESELRNRGVKTLKLESWTTTSIRIPQRSYDILS